MNAAPWTEIRDVRRPAPPCANAVDLWLIDLDGARPSITGALNVEERRRAGRFAFARDARRFAAARGYLRHILGARLDCPPAEIAFEVGPWGKPALPPSVASCLAFNLSHSGGQALIALAHTASLGVDLEEMRPIDGWQGLMDTFASYEAQSILRTRPSAQMDAFFACWTRREAVVKLWGEGFSADLHSFEVSTDPDAPARILSVTRPGITAADISLWSFKATPRSWAALAIPAVGGSVELRFWRLI
ncbi:4'-phosphopantetheinyl transferase family protein [Chelatococcus reniformis]|uniref:4'-phosphopantetheinyl transferase n=1 Tax=Chelatococcus reniformis TaxID=1494448 RepID=A0A916UN02_9HYPH|nr:4'-phosphopantetheinyl transferase superfamily protein [Chelatococcus reniformis]GGC78351.1 4'-phosphopantetheinyl transferase [Chelatococcus reniformis]